MPDGLPEGRLVAIGSEASGSLAAEPGELRETLTIDGQPLADLAPGTRLRVGDALVVEVTGVPGPEVAVRRPDAGLRDGPTGLWVSARVVAEGTVRVGDAVVIEAVPILLEGALDLHPFHPEEVPAVVGEYLDHARAAGFAEVRIIHGRGRGVQRETVRRLLAGSSLVSAFGDAPPERGGWGATIVRLRTTPRDRPA